MTTSNRTKSETMLDYAEHCRQMADRTSDTAKWLVWLDAANRYLRLAELYHERGM